MNELIEAFPGDLPYAYFIPNIIEAVLTKRVKVWIPRQELRHSHVGEISHNTITGIQCLPSIRITLRGYTNRGTNGGGKILAVEIQVVFIQQTVCRDIEGLCY